MNYKITDSTREYSDGACEIRTHIGNQTLSAMMEIIKETTDATYWNYSICVYNKKTQIYDNFDYKKATGSTIKGMFRGKECLAWIESYIEWHYGDKKNIIIIEGSDARRKRIYERKLKDVGYHKGRYDGKEVLIKTLRKLNGV